MLERQITLQEYKDDNYPDILDNMKLDHINIKRHGIVILTYV